MATKNGTHFAVNPDFLFHWEGYEDNKHIITCYAPKPLDSERRGNIGRILE